MEKDELCRKLSFLSLIEATEKISQIQSNPNWVKGKRFVPYQCDTCRQWHITSKYPPKREIAKSFEKAKQEVQEKERYLDEAQYWKEKKLNHTRKSGLKKMRKP